MADNNKKKLVFFTYYTAELISRLSGIMEFSDEDIGRLCQFCDGENIFETFSSNEKIKCFFDKNSHVKKLFDAALWIGTRMVGLGRLLPVNVEAVEIDIKYFLKENGIVYPDVPSDHDIDQNARSGVIEGICYTLRNWKFDSGDGEWGDMIFSVKADTYNVNHDTNSNNGSCVWDNTYLEDGIEKKEQLIRHPLCCIEYADNELSTELSFLVNSCMHAIHGNLSAARRQPVRIKSLVICIRREQENETKKSKP